MFFLLFCKFQTVKDGKNLSCYVSLPFMYKFQYSLNHILDAKIKKTMKIAKSSKMNLVFKLEHYYFLYFEFAG